MLKELLKNTRTHRSFTKKTLNKIELEELIEATRYGASARNSQLLRYIIINNKDICDKIFPHLAFAGAISWNPTINEAPTSYILICADKSHIISENLLYFDMGIATQNILLTATKLGFAGCILVAYNKAKVEEIVNLKSSFSSYVLIALGEPQDTVTITEGKPDTLTYFRDEKNNHFVPKLPLKELIIQSI